MQRRAEQQAQAYVVELLALWRAGEASGRAASVLGLQAGACRATLARYATHVDRAARRAGMADRRRGGARARSIDRETG